MEYIFILCDLTRILLQIEPAIRIILDKIIKSNYANGLRWYELEDYDRSFACFRNCKFIADFFYDNMFRAEITKHIPEFKCSYNPDFRQSIADSWPKSIDDSAARKEWDWKPAFNLSTMTKDMLDKLGKRFEEGNL